MAACGSLEHIFEKPLPENPALIESITSWKQMESMKPIDDSSFTEIFGELHFKENHASESSSSSPLPQSSPSSSLSSNSTFFPDMNKKSDNEILNREKNESLNSNNLEKAKSLTPSYYPTSTDKKQYRHSSSFSSVNSDNLSLCTEGLGFESFDDVEDLLRNDICNEFQHEGERKSITTNTQTERQWSEYSKRSRTGRGSFPPPISCIGRSGKPWVCFKSYRENGRFILKEIRIPTQEFMHSCRENGRLKLQFIHSDEEILQDDEDEDEDEEEDEDNIEEINEEPCKNDEVKSEGDVNEEGRNNGEGNVEIYNCNVQGS